MLRILHFLFFFYCCAYNGTMIQGQTLKDSTFTILSTSIYFENDEHRISQENIDSLEQFLIKNKAKNRIKFILEGHTNEIGSIEYNQSLSEKRVESIYQQLVSMGVNPEIIQKAAYGKTKPDWPNNEDGLEKNRQVKINIKKNIKLRKIIGYAGTPDIKLPFTTINFENIFFKSSVITDSSGYFEIYVPDKMDVTVSATKLGYINDFLTVVPNEKTNPLIVKLSKIENGASIYITSLYFEGDKNILLESSNASLSHLTEQVKKNSTFCFEIQGHVNAPHLRPAEITPFLMQLSKARAGLIYQHFMNNNIDETRMYANGYGNTKMIYPRPKKDSEHIFNRRVELKIYNCDFVKEQRVDFDESLFLDLAKRRIFK